MDILFDHNLPPRERVEFFFEAMGNTLIRERTAIHISNRVDTLQDLVYGEAVSHPLSEIFDFSCLLERDKDSLADCMKGWRIKSGGFDIELLRDQRCRHAYGNRFDVRVNMFDYDFVQNLQPFTTIVHWQEFKLFRQLGLAFEPRTAAYKTPNRTLGSYVKGNDKKTGRPIMVRGFWGDLMNGPFFSFGIDTWKNDKERLFKLFSEQHRHYSAEVGEFNLTSLLVSIYLGEEFHLRSQKEEETVYPFKSPLDSVEGFEHRDAERTAEQKTKNEMQKDIAEEHDDSEESKKEAERILSTPKEDVKIKEIRNDSEVDLKSASAGALTRLSTHTGNASNLPGLRNLKKITFLLGADIDKCLSRRNLTSSSEQQKTIHSAFIGALASGALLRPVGLINKQNLDDPNPFGSIEKAEFDDSQAIEPVPSNPSVVDVKCQLPFEQKGALIGNLDKEGKLYVESFKYQCHFAPAVKLRFRSRIHQAIKMYGMTVCKNSILLRSDGSKKIVMPDINLPTDSIEEAGMFTKLTQAEKNSSDILCFKWAD